MKSSSVFFNESLRKKIRSNCSACKNAAKIRDQKISEAKGWYEKGCDELWGLMFSPAIKRSWMVLSYGWCPACRKNVNMYDWIIDAVNKPWKLQCPHCGELFPKNDFKAYYESGLDEKGIFRYEKALAGFLVNREENSGDKRRGRNFGVDDGNGYLGENGDRWMFVGTYLIYGQWKQLVMEGIKRLSEAFIVTGEIEYARKALVLIDRVADVYPGFDFREQGFMYEEERTSTGYISYWAGACDDVRDIAIAYDQIFDAVKEDASIIGYIHETAVRRGFLNDKSDFSKIRENIETNIFRHTIDHSERIRTNFPHTDITLAIIKAIMGWPGNREEIGKLIKYIIEKSTLVDGVTGEKGTGGYASIGPNALAGFLSFFSNLYPDFLEKVLKEYPVLKDTYRFHIDTWCLERYYPGCGDMGTFAAPSTAYGNSILSREGAISKLAMSNEHFMWKLYKLTGDADFARAIYISNGYTSRGCFEGDITAENPEELQAELDAVIHGNGCFLNQKSVDKQAWKLAVLHSGRGGDKRSMWIDYDSGGNHGHHDALNIGIMAKGLDLMPDFGYPPVNRGGWDTPRFHWYIMPASHNLVVVDGKSHINLPKGGFLNCPEYGKTILWKIGDIYKAGYFKAPEYIGGKRYERLAVLIDLSEKDCYCFDVFRVEGGREHTRFTRSSFSTVKCGGLSLEAGKEYGYGTFMRNFKCDAKPASCWSADFKIIDEFGVREEGADVHLKYTGLTRGAEVSVCESWIDLCDWAKIRKAGRSAGKAGGNAGKAGDDTEADEAWIPTIMERRTSEEDGLFSAFAGIYEPYEEKSNLLSVRRLELTDENGNSVPDSNVGVEVKTVNGFKDILIAKDPEYPGTVCFGRFISDGSCFTFYRQTEE